MIEQSAVETSQPGYITMKALAAYASCSVRWLRARLVDKSYPLPHYRVEGKLLVKLAEFDAWIAQYRVSRPTDELNRIVEEVVSHVRPPKRAA